MEGRRKIHSVNWRVVTSPKEWQGLGAKDLKVLIKLYCGSGYGFGVQENPLWRRVLAEKESQVFRNKCKIARKSRGFDTKKEK